MPRKYVKKKEEAIIPADLKQAVIDVIDNRMSIRKSAEMHKIKKSTLCNYIKKVRDQGIENTTFSSNFKKSQVFSDELEKLLEEYLIKCSKMFYGLTPKAIRKLAFDYAVKNSLKIPDSWSLNKTAGKDWFSNFLQRHPKLSIRKPEPTSLARMTSFNPTTVKIFQDKLEEVILRYCFRPYQIFNLDETGITTVQKIPKVVGAKGEHQIGQIASRERGELVTQVGIICAAGTSLPPVWIFPRKRFDEQKMMNGVANSGSLGLVHQSGWMTSENFIEVLKHVVKNTRCTTDSKILLIMDNHESHISLGAIEYCRGNGIVILTLPPHTSNKLQPLDRTIFGPFKTFFNDGVNAWLMQNPGQTISIYNLPAIGLNSWDRAANPVNIKSGFKCTGIVPFDRNVFTEDEFLSSFVTDRPAPPEATVSSFSNADQPSTSKTIGTLPATTLSQIPDLGTLSTSAQNVFITPEQIAPYPKAPERKNSMKGRKRGKSMIATDSPEKLEIEEKAKRAASLKTPKRKKTIKKKLVTFENDDENEVICKDSSSDDNFLSESEEEDPDLKNIDVNEFAIIKVYGKATIRNYVGEITKQIGNGYEVTFLKRHVASNRFSVTDETNIFVPYTDMSTTSSP